MAEGLGGALAWGVKDQRLHTPVPHAPVSTTGVPCSSLQFTPVKNEAEAAFSAQRRTDTAMAGHKEQEVDNLANLVELLLM